MDLYESKRRSLVEEKTSSTAPSFITFPVFILAVLVIVGSIFIGMGYMIEHKEIDDNARLLSTIALYATFIFVLKYMYKWLVPSLINMDKKKEVLLINRLRDQLLGGKSLDPEENLILQSIFNKPGFDMEHYKKNVEGFIELIKNAQNTESRMKQDFIEAHSNMI